MDRGRTIMRYVLAFTLAVLCLGGLVLSPGCSAVSSFAVATSTPGSTPATTPASTTPSTVSSPDASGKLLLGVMVHLEGWQGEVRNQQMFQQHAALAREYAATFEKYGLGLTFEASPEFTRACARWNDNVIKELSDRGHGIGVHADLGNQPGLTQQGFVAGLKRMKSDIESLGVKVRHVSGVCSSLDWVTAVRDAGFGFVSGTVEYALKSIPASKLPAEYRDVLSVTNPAQAHGNVPHELSDRLHPWRMASGADWLWSNPEGKVVIIPGDGGTCITNMADDESATGRSGRAVFDSSDIEAFSREVDRALSLVVPDRVNALYVGWSIGQRADSATVDSWAQACRGYVDSGRATWNTLPGMYDAFLSWEAGK